MNLKKSILITIIITILTNCSSHKYPDTYQLKKLNKEEQKKFITTNIDTLGGANLGNFMYHIEQSNVNLNLYDETLKAKLEKTDFSYDIYHLVSTLLNKKSNTTLVEDFLNKNFEKWDIGNWGAHFWKLIKEHNLSVKKPSDYTFENGTKVYDIEKFMHSKIAAKELGENPMLILNSDIISYKKGTLFNVLKNYTIIQIDFKNIKESIPLYGFRGKEGVLYIMTKTE